MKYLFVICGVFAALLFLLLLRKKDRQNEHLFLAAIFFLITINSFYVFQFYRSDDFFYVPFFSELNYAIPLLYGPLFWLYTKALTTANYKLNFKNCWHFFPFIIFFLILISPLLFGVQLLESDHVGYPFIKLLITPFYLIGVLIILKNYRKDLLNSYSYEQEVNLMWLSWITVGAIALWILALSGYIYNSVTEAHKTLLYDFYVLSFLSIYLFGLTYVAITKTDIFKASDENNTPKKIQAPTIIESLKDSQTAQEESSELSHLKSVMLNKKPYLDPLLSIGKLSTICNIPQYKISKILNTQLNQSFYDFVNGYRVDDVKIRLANGEANDFSILGVAQEAGFNSKASFNRVFKKKEGMTPSEYLKTLNLV